MTVATRALFTGAFPDALPRGGLFEPLALTASPEAGWGNVQWPRAITYGGILWVPYVDGSGNASVLRWDIGAGTGAVSTLASTGEVDDHDTPAIHRFSDGSMVAVWTTHSADAFRALSADGVTWGAASNITSQLGAYGGEGGYNYARLWEDGDGLHLWLRHGSDTGAENIESISTNGGSTWSARSVFYDGTYLYMVKSGDRIDVATRVNSTIDGPVCHGYFEGGDWHDSEGNVLSVPFDDSDLTQVVTYDGTHRVGTWDIAPGPVIATARWVTADISEHTYRYARWDGDSWVVTDVALVGTTLGGFAIDPADPSIVYLSRRPSSVSQMYRYVTGDGGATWPTGLIRQLTDAASHQHHGIVPLSADARMPVAWMAGEFPTAGITALRRTTPP